MRILLLICVLAVITAGCSNYALTTIENPNCKTIISGKTICATKWNYQNPAIIAENLFGGEMICLGLELKKVDSGFNLKQYSTREKRFLNRFFKFDEVQYAVDSIGNSVYGTLPEKYAHKWKMHIEFKSIDTKSNNSFSLEIFPNRKFSFCVEPGIYEVESMYFESLTTILHTDIVDNEDLPEIILDIQPNTINYIGDIYLDSLVPNKTITKITCKEGIRPKDIYPSNLGLIGGLLTKAQKYGNYYYHTLAIKNEPPIGFNGKESLLQIK